MFLTLYDQYVREVKKPAWHLIVQEELFKLALKAVQLKYIVDVEGNELRITSRSSKMWNCVNWGKMINFGSSWSIKSRIVIVMLQLTRYRSYSKKSFASPCPIRSRAPVLSLCLFLTSRYSTVVALNGSTEITRDIALRCFAVVRPESLFMRVESDPNFSRYELRKTFEGFIAHTTKLFEAFRVVENGGPSRQKKAHTGGGGGSIKDRANLSKSKNEWKTNTKVEKGHPLLFGIHKKSRAIVIFREIVQRALGMTKSNFQATRDGKCRSWTGQSTWRQVWEAAKVVKKAGQGCRRRESNLAQ